MADYNSLPMTYNAGAGAPSTTTNGAVQNWWENQLSQSSLTTQYIFNGVYFNNTVPGYSSGGSSSAPATFAGPSGDDLMFNEMCGIGN